MATHIIRFPGADIHTTKIKSTSGDIDSDGDISLLSSGITNVTIKSGGNVGIGNISPSFKLDVNGDLNFTGTLYQGGVAYAGSPWTTSGSDIYYTTGNIGVGLNSPAYTLDVGGTANVGVLTTTSVSGNGSGLTALNGTQVTTGTVASARIANLDAGKITTGTLGRPISTTDGTFTGTVSFGSATRQMLNLYSTAYALGVQSSTLYYRSGGGYAWFKGGVHSDTANAPGTGGALAMKLDSSYNLTATGDVTAYSDKRVKTDISKIDNALEKVCSINGYTYKRTDTEDEKRHTGVLAQEVMKVLPEVVHGSEETTYSVAYGNMAGLFIEAMKEMKSQLDAALRRIDELEKRL